MAYYRGWDRSPSTEEILSDRCIVCPNRIADPAASCAKGVVHGFAVDGEDTYSIDVCGQDFIDVKQAHIRKLCGVVTTIYQDSPCI